MKTYFETQWRELEMIGRDPETGGYRRSAWSVAEAEVRDWFTRAASDLGLAVEIDRNGNIWAWWEGPWGDRSGRGQLIMGSHLDSVPDGGAFDGPLGIVSALAAVQDLMLGAMCRIVPLGSSPSVMRRVLALAPRVWGRAFRRAY